MKLIYKDHTVSFTLCTLHQFLASTTRVDELSAIADTTLVLNDGGLHLEKYKNIDFDIINIYVSVS